MPPLRVLPPLCLLLALGCASTGALPPQAIDHNRVGAERLEAGRLDDAEARFRLALEFHPGFAEPHANLGLVMLERGDLGEAEHCFRAAIRIDPDFDEAWANLGVVLLRMDRIDDATRAFEEALSIDPGHVGARRNLADVWMMRGDHGQARAHLMRLVQLVDEPGSAAWARANGMLAYAELRLGRREAARARAEAVLASKGREPLARTVRGILHAEAGEVAAARTDLESAAEDPLVGWDARLRLAALAVATGRLGAARSRLARLREEQPDAPAVELVAAHLALAAEDRASARAHAERALALAPELRAAETLLAQLQAE
jgi:tetratricopeptide (TPR) repeat protein